MLKLGKTQLDILYHEWTHLIHLRRISHHNQLKANIYSVFFPLLYMQYIYHKSNPKRTFQWHVQTWMHGHLRWELMRMIRVCWHHLAPDLLVLLQIIDFFQTWNALGPKAAAHTCEISLGLGHLKFVHLLLKALHVSLQPIYGLS